MFAPSVRWGILAPGWIAGQFASALRQGTRLQIAAVGSRDLGQARAFADEHGAPVAYGSYQQRSSSVFAPGTRQERSSQEVPVTGLRLGA